MLRNLNSNFRFRIRPVTGRDFPVTAVTGNPDPPRDFFSIGNQNLGCMASRRYRTNTDAGSYSQLLTEIAQLASGMSGRIFGICPVQPASSLRRRTATLSSTTARSTAGNRREAACCVLREEEWIWQTT
jgi:hypothetical protein